MTTLSQDERAALADALQAAGPDAPTLCEGWTARDVAAHLAARERRPDSTPGLVLAPFKGWTESVRLGYARRDYADLVELVRTGPPWFSPFVVVDRFANLVEHFVHTEDVRRGNPGWVPRELSPALDAALWTAVSRGGKAFFRKARVGVVLQTPDGRSVTVRQGDPAVTVVGAPGELVLLAYGRRSAAQVEIRGDEATVADFGRTPLGI